MSIYIIDDNYSTIIIDKYGSSYEYYKNNNIYKYNNYNDELKALIQRNATQNYPRISLRKKEEGIVELNFSIDINGNILNITAGKKTNAPQRLINASINTLKLISPHKKNPILKKNNTFSIIIVYKLEQNYDKYFKKAC